MPLVIELDYDRGVPVYRQICEAVLAALSTGQLAPDEQLPTIHELARTLSINPNTVAKAYKDLERRGHIVSQRGRGTFPRPSSTEKPDTIDQHAVLRTIYQRAIAEAGRHQISARDLVRFFRRSLQDDTP